MKRLATFNVTLEIDPEAYADEFGDNPASAKDAADYAVRALRARMTQAIPGGGPNGGTIPSFEENNGHWVKVHISEHALLPVHRDGLLPGFRNPYNTDKSSEHYGMFKGLCTCGAEFWGSDPQEADSLMLEHCDEMNDD